MRSLTLRINLSLLVVAVIVTPLLVLQALIDVREQLFLEKFQRAFIALYTLSTSEGNELGAAEQRIVLERVGALAIAIRQGNNRVIAQLTDRAPIVEQTLFLGQSSRMERFAGTISDLFSDSRPVLRMLGAPFDIGRLFAGRSGDSTIRMEIILDKTSLRQTLRARAVRIVLVGCILALTGCLALWGLIWSLVVSRLTLLSAAMTRFAGNPQDRALQVSRTTRRDEIGRIQNACAYLQEALRQRLLQQQRLAALGAAIARINHDLKGILTPALLLSDSLTSRGDPEVVRTAGRLTEAVRRGVLLSEQILTYARSHTVQMSPRHHVLAEMAVFTAGPRNSCVLHTEGLAGWQINIDADQFARVVENLVNNAAQAGAQRVDVSVTETDDGAEIRPRDDGPGIPEAVRERLFEPFGVSTRRHGNGLGMAIARELTEEAGGRLILLESGPTGTGFALRFPRPLLWRADGP